jgi:serine/threonine-protein kinase
MMTTDLGACEWFVWDLRRSNLIDRGQLDQVIGEFLQKNPGAEPPALSEYLIGQGILTDFQAERLLQGKTQGFVLGPFTLMDSLGTGSMGTVYKARSKTDSAWYAVKVLPRRSMWNVRIARRKVRSFEQCRHPSVVPFVDVGTSGGMHYLAWPMVEGETLDKIVEKHGRLKPEDAARYALQAAEGLELCHRQNLFHGLLKPSNLMIGTDGSIRILDFGIGCLLAETEGESLVDTMSTANSVNSGLDCASPESIMDPTNLTPLGDQYSLGCTIYYCLTGRYPFPDGTAVEKMMSHQAKQPASLKQLAPDTPDELVAVVERLMQKNPQDRFADCKGVMEALRPFASAAPAVTRRTMSMPRVTLARPGGAGPAPSAPATPPAVAPASASRPQPRPAGLPPRPATPPQATPAQVAPAAKPMPRPLRPAGLAPAPKPVRVPDPEPEAEYEPQSLPDLELATEPALEAEPDELPQEAAAPAPPVEQGMGNTGVILLAVLAGVVAWLLSSMIQL